MKTIFVSGIGGFLGGVVARLAIQKGYRVVGIGIDPLVSELSAKTDYCVSAPVTVDAISEIFKRTGSPDVFVHAAGNGKVGTSWPDPYDDFLNNAASTAAVVEALRRFSPETVLILPSSAAVYGDVQIIPTSEDAPRAPISPYGVHKQMAEDICIAASNLFGMKCIVLRIFSLYGPGLKKQLVWDIFHRLKSHPRELVLSGVADASRDFLFVDDCVEQMFLAAEQCQQYPCILNSGTGRGTSIHDIATQLIDLMSPTTELIFDGQTRPGDPHHMRADISKAMALGFHPKTKLEDGIRKYLDWAEQQ